jgi:hypothetical protein
MLGEMVVNKYTLSDVVLGVCYILDKYNIKVTVSNIELAMFYLKRSGIDVECEFTFMGMFPKSRTLINTLMTLSQQKRLVCNLESKFCCVNPCEYTDHIVELATSEILPTALDLFVYLMEHQDNPDLMLSKIMYVIHLRDTLRTENKSDNIASVWINLWNSGYVTHQYKEFKEIYDWIDTTDLYKN